jgi:hypothetical protein
MPVTLFALAPQGLDSSNGRPRIHLRGRARVEAHAAREAGEMVLAGTATDDAGRPAALRVALELTRTEKLENRNPIAAKPAGVEAQPISLASVAPEACRVARADSPHDLVSLESPTRILLSTGALGQFCVRLSLPPAEYTAHLTAEGTSSSAPIDPTAVDLPFDAARRPVRLEFAGTRHGSAMAVCWLDEGGANDAASAEAEVIATTEVDGAAQPLDRLALHLTNEAGQALGSAVTDDEGRGRFVLAPSLLGPPGPGELRVAFEGNAAFGAASATQAVQRRTHVTLSLPASRNAALPPASPEDGISLAVRATQDCASRGCGGDPRGIVEARAQGALVGASPIFHGEAHLFVTFTPPPAAVEAVIELHYVPASPWWVERDVVVVAQPVLPPGIAGRLAVGIAGALVLAWFVLARVRSNAAARERSAPRVQKPTPPTARVTLIESTGQNSGWRGYVIDGHNRRAVPGAAVVVAQRTFAQVASVVSSATSDSSGAFELPAAPAEVTRSCDIVVRAHLYADFRTACPPEGVLEIALTLRRRVLLERLVEWARRRGGPFHLRPEPTPGHVRLIAVAQAGLEPHREAKLEQWAAAVEEAAFGPEPVDERVQSRVEELAPNPARQGPQKDARDRRLPR